MALLLIAHGMDIMSLIDIAPARIDTSSPEASSISEPKYLLWGGVQLRQLAAQRKSISCGHLILGHSSCPVCKDPQPLHIFL